MRITFANAELRAAACSQTQLIKQFGPQVGKKVCQRLTELHATPSLLSATKLSFLNIREEVDGYSMSILGTHQICFRKAPTNNATRATAPLQDSIEVFSIKEIQND